MTVADRKTFLVALDFGPHSDAALDEAMGLAALSHATIHLVHVFTLPDKRETVLMSGNMYKYLETAEHTQLQSRRARCRAGGRLGAVLWRQGDASAQILLTAAAVGADMIIVGASQRSLLTHTRLGSVAEAVVRKAPCTVMVVRKKSAGRSVDN